MSGAKENVMATGDQLVIEALKPFEDDDLTTSALRVLAFTAANDAERAIKRRDYKGGQEAAYALLRVLEILDQRKGGDT